MVIVINNDATFQSELAKAGAKLVLVDFFATWCGPCHRIAPFFEDLSRRYPRVTFLKVDVDRCPETASMEGITAMPTFYFYRNKVKLSKIQGDDATALENRLAELVTDDEKGRASDVIASGGAPTADGHVDLATFINKSACECLNDSDDHPFSECLTAAGGYLESDCDEQLIMSYGFHQAVKLHSLKIAAPKENGPKTLKLFINQPRALDFDQADSMEPVQVIDIQPDELSGDKPILLKYVKYQNVMNFQIFVKDNQGNSETTRINHLAIVGSPITMTNMNDFKRVAGKKGESH